MAEFNYENCQCCGGEGGIDCIACPNTLPSILFISLSGWKDVPIPGAYDHSCINGSWQLTWNGVNAWFFSGPCGPISQVSIAVGCGDGAPDRFSVSIGWGAIGHQPGFWSAGAVVEEGGAVCNPLMIPFDNFTAGGVHEHGTWSGTVTA